MHARGLALLGGSFNPPHIGHLRLAIELSECLGTFVDRVLLVPSAYPPHKQGSAMLPFSLRCDMLEESVASLERIEVSRVEGERRTLSYTWDTLRLFRSFCPGTELYFVLGSDDYEQLPDWYKGLELPRITNFIVVPRGTFGIDSFARLTSRLWPAAKRSTSRSFSCLDAGVQDVEGMAFDLPGGGRVLFFPLSYLAISATEIRGRWRQGRDLKYLVPEGVLGALQKNHALVAEAWGTL